MASAAVSTCVDYNQPTVVTTHCGEVYCSEKLEVFVVICTKCSQVFNLLSSNLFIQHMQICLSAGRRDVGFKIQSNPNCTIGNVSTSGEHRDKVDAGECSDFDAPSSVRLQIEVLAEAPIDEISLGEEKGDFMHNDPFIETAEIFGQNSKIEGNNSRDDPLPLIEEEEDNACKAITLSIIEEYKSHPSLWDINYFRASSRSSRLCALQAITNAINIKHNKSFDETAIRRKIFLLRENYRRVLRTKEDFEREHPNEETVFPIHLYYFDQISFIGSAFDDADLFCKKSTSTAQIKETDNAHEPLLINSDGDSGKSDENLFEGALSDYRELATCIIEEYKKQPCLWSAHHFEKCRSVRRTAFAKMAKAIHKRTDLKFPIERLSSEIARLRCSYFRMVTKKKKNPNYNTLLWYANIFSFIENKDDVGEAVKEVNTDVSSDDGYNIATSEKVNKKRNQVLPKAHALALIELYRAAPVLWDTNHIQFAIRSEQKKSFDHILSALSAEHNCHLTLDQLRHQIRYFRVYYFRTRGNATAAENGNIAKFTTTPYLYEQLSFLEPFAKQTTAPKLQANTETVAINDVAYLTENRPLMINFIELYKEQGCLWDQRHKDLGDPSAQSEAYDRIVSMLSQNDVVVTKEQVMTAISYLHSVVVSTIKENKEPIWFYELLKFLGGDKRVVNKYCTHCSTQFRTLREYEKHKIEIAGDFPYKCALCGKGFLTRARYFYHQNTHKTPHKCDQCDFTASDKNNLKIHMHRHNRVTRHGCQDCDKAFVTTTELKRHIRTHTGERPFVCEICGKKMPTASEYNLHMKRHRNQRDHKCKVCSRAFFDPEGLRKHMAIHSDERKHVCDNCGAAFKTRHTWSQHKKLHDGKKAHVCKICGKCFAQQTGLYSHMKSHSVVFDNS